MLKMTFLRPRKTPFFDPLCKLFRGGKGVIFRGQKRTRHQTRPGRPNPLKTPFLDPPCKSFRGGKGVILGGPKRTRHQTRPGIFIFDIFNFLLFFNFFQKTLIFSKKCHLKNHLKKIVTIY